MPEFISLEKRLNVVASSSGSFIILEIKEEGKETARILFNAKEISMIEKALREWRESPEA
jgi:hypothetical protein